MNKRLFNISHFNPLQPTGHVMHQQFNIQHLHVLPTLYLCVLFCLRTNSDLWHLQHKLIGFYNRDEKGLLRGTNWVFKCLRTNSDLWHLQHKLIGFYNRDEMCLLCGTNWVFKYLRTNSDLCHLQHKLIGFYNRDEKCLLRGTKWVFITVCASYLNVEFYSTKLPVAHIIVGRT